jgi:hypothetical protein
MTQLPSGQHITYQLQYRKCGKAACGICRHSRGHGPYWYAYWRDGSRLRSGYIGKIHPDAVQTSISPDQTGTNPMITSEETSAALAF